MTRTLTTATRGLAAATALLVAPAAGAQSRGDAGLDLTLARHAIRGGTIDFRTGALLDVLAAGRVRAAPRWSLVVAGGAGVVFGGMGDRCLLRPDGSCAPRGNVRIVDALVGAALPVGPATVRTLLGPALHDGAGDRSVGLQGRLDLAAPVLARLGLGAMLRATVLPSHGGERLTLWAAGGSLTLR